MAWTINPQNTLSLVGGGNAGFAKSTNYATPLLNNNGQIYNVIYTFNAAPIVITPYFQETNIPFNPDIGVLKSTQTIGGAVLASYAVTDKISVAGRAEYIGATGNENSPEGSAANLLYGIGSDCVVSDVDADLPMESVLLPRRGFVRAGEQLYGG